MLTYPKDESSFAVMPMFMIGFDFDRTYIEYHKADNGDSFCRCTDTTLDKWLYLNHENDLVISDRYPITQSIKCAIEKSLYVPDMVVQFYFGMTLRELSSKFQTIVRFDDAGYKKENLPLVKALPDAPAIVVKAYNQGILRCEPTMGNIPRLALTRNITELIRLAVWSKDEIEEFAKRFTDVNAACGTRLSKLVREDVYSMILNDTSTLH